MRTFENGSPCQHNMTFVTSDDESQSFYYADKKYVLFEEYIPASSTNEQDLYIDYYIRPNKGNMCTILVHIPQLNIIPLLRKNQILLNRFLEIYPDFQEILDSTFNDCSKASSQKVRIGLFEDFTQTNNSIEKYACLYIQAPIKLSREILIPHNYESNFLQHFIKLIVEPGILFIMAYEAFMSSIKLQQWGAKSELSKYIDFFYKHYNRIPCSIDINDKELKDLNDDIKNYLKQVDCAILKTHIDGSWEINKFYTPIHFNKKVKNIYFLVNPSIFSNSLKNNKLFIVSKLIRNNYRSWNITSGFSDLPNWMKKIESLMNFSHNRISAKHFFLFPCSYILWFYSNNSLKKDIWSSIRIISDSVNKKDIDAVRQIVNKETVLKLTDKLKKFILVGDELKYRSSVEMDFFSNEWQGLSNISELLEVQFAIIQEMVTYDQKLKIMNKREDRQEMQEIGKTLIKIGFFIVGVISRFQGYGGPPLGRNFDKKEKKIIFDDEREKIYNISNSE